MQTRVVKIDPLHFPESLIDEVVNILMQGGIIGYPTETVYGLGGDAKNEDTVKKIYRLKARDPQNPFLVLVARKKDLAPFVKCVPEKARILMKHFWPGSLTLVFEASPVLPKILLGEANQLGVRISPDPVCRILLENFPNPLVSTSANPTGMKPAHSASEILNYFKENVDLILDVGEKKLKHPSTILDVTQDPPKLLRRGSIDIEEIEKVIGEVSESKGF